MPGRLTVRALLARLLAALALILVTAAPAAAVTLHRGNQSEPDTLDPHKATGSWESNILGDLFLGLTTEDAGARPVPGAAASWTVSDDGRTWTFKMREGAVWSDGEPVTARDFVFSLRRQLDPATASQYASMLYDIVNAEAVNAGTMTLDQLGVSAPDDQTLVIRLNHPAPYLAQLLMHQVTYPVPQHVYEKFGDDWVKPANFVSNGPFKLMSWRPNSHVHAVKNERFYDAANVKIDEIYYYPTDDAEAALKRFRTGELDLNIGFPSQQIEYLRKDMAAELHVATLVNVRYIAINTLRKPFDDMRVRRAIALAIDREAITGQILRAGEEPAYSIVPPGTAGYENGPRVSFADAPMSERLEEARRLLAEAGFSPSNPLRFTFAYISDNDSRRVAAALQAMWKSVGIQVELGASEKKVHYNTIRAQDYDVAEANWFADFNDAKNFLFLTQPSAGDMNIPRYANQVYEDLIDRSDQEADAAARAALMKEAEALMLEETPLTPLYFGVSRNLVQRWVKGWEDNLLNVNRSRYMSIERSGADVNAAPGVAGEGETASSSNGGDERPWYWFLVAVWEWFLGLLCSWFGIACPAG